MSDVNAEHGPVTGPETGSEEAAVTETAADPTSDRGPGPAGARPAGANGAGASPGSDDPAGDGTGEHDAHDTPDGDVSEVSVEGLVSDLERVTAERDQFLETSRRIQAEFENYRKQVTKRETEARQRANEGLIGEMLPVLDAFDSALSSGVDDVAPMRTTLLEALAKQGLERIDPVEAPFDPNLHEAVMHEESDGGETGPVVAEVMRAGYAWKGRVVRPAMVRVRG